MKKALGILAKKKKYTFDTLPSFSFVRKRRLPQKKTDDSKRTTSNAILRIILRAPRFHEKKIIKKKKKKEELTHDIVLAAVALLALLPSVSAVKSTAFVPFCSRGAVTSTISPVAPLFPSRIGFWVYTKPITRIFF